MTVALWRIATESRAYAANELRRGAFESTEGRWNSQGTPMVYCAVNIALAVLETLGHLRGGTLPYNRFLVRVDVPDPIWALREVVDQPPTGWDAVPFGLTSMRFGDAWVKSQRSPLLLLPSSIVPDEQIALINPAHPQTADVVATNVRRWQYDPRFF